MELGGVRYSHVLDPRTGKPLTGRSAVTIIAKDATTSDAMAKAVAVLGPDAGIRLADATPGVQALMGFATQASRSAGWRRPTGVDVDAVSSYWILLATSKEIADAEGHSSRSPC